MAKKRSKPKVKEHGKSSKKQFNDEVQEQKSSSFFTAVIATLGIIFAFIWTHYIKNNDDVVLSLRDLLSMVRRSDSFNLTNSGSRTLLATDGIKSGTILMEISRDMMIWDIDACRNEFIRRELFSVLKGDILDNTIVISSFITK